MANAFCTECGAKLDEKTKFCTSCGAPVEDYVVEAEDKSEQNKKEEEIPHIEYVPHTAPYEPEQPAYTRASMHAADFGVPAKGSMYEPISTKGFIGIFLLMCIPIVNIILLIVWACGACQKINKTNFARGALLLMLIMILITIITGIVLYFVIGADKLQYFFYNLLYYYRLN